MGFRTGTVAFVTIALGVSATAAAEPPPPEPTPTPTPTPAEPREAPAELEIAAPSRRQGATTARVVTPTFARPRPGSRRRGLRLRTQTAWSGQAHVLLVLKAATVDGKQWVKVLLAERPNGSTGWILRDHVVLRRTRYWVDVRLRSRRVTVYRNGNRVRRLRAVIGSAATPTPRGLAAIYERNRQPDRRAFLGPWALPLTSHSNVLKNYGGGPGRVGIHGRAGASLRDPLGTARSHGCIRVDNRDVSWMAAKLPAGTPVDVRR
jgi:lipoprotein-anchoring transpeptidase ErfK/SrfK